MAISGAEKAAFNDETKGIKKTIDGYYHTIKEIQAKKKHMPAIAGYYNLEMVTTQMMIIQLFLKINDICLEMLKLKHENSLNEARKEFYKVLQNVEEVVGSDIDRSLKENDEYLEKIDRFNAQQILDFVRQLESVYYNLKNKMGESSKWKWSFVELQARLAVIIKNITKFSDIAKLRDPRTEHYYARKEMMQLCKESLAEAAKQYRTKYELSGKARDDLKKCIDLLSALRRIHILFGESDEATKLKTTIDAAQQAMDAEDKAKEKDKKEKKQK